MFLLDNNGARPLLTILALLVVNAAFSPDTSTPAYNSHVLAAKRAAAPPSVSRPNSDPVIVELFTSEGCSSCPPADALLARLEQEQPIPSANIITLEEHVDYWDHLGWRDRFSSPRITQRQQDYAAAFHLDDVFTPQFVVNGSAQFNGTNLSAIEKAITQASATTVPLQFASVRVGSNSVTFKLADSPVTHSEHIRIYAALVDPQDTSRIRTGENAGRTLHHVDTVRTIEMVGESSRIRDLSNRPFSITFPGPPGPFESNLVRKRLVVFLQTTPAGPIVAAVAHTIIVKDVDPHEKPDTPIKDSIGDLPVVPLTLPPSP